LASFSLHVRAEMQSAAGENTVYDADHLPYGRKPYKSAEWQNFWKTSDTANGLTESLQMA